MSPPHSPPPFWEWFQGKVSGRDDGEWEGEEGRRIFPTSIHQFHKKYHQFLFWEE